VAEKELGTRARQSDVRAVRIVCDQATGVETSTCGHHIRMITGGSHRQPGTHTEANDTDGRDDVIPTDQGVQPGNRVGPGLGRQQAVDPRHRRSEEFGTFLVGVQRAVR